MELYFAPLEGIGGYIYRNAQAEFFAKADKYFTPFISPMKDRGIRPREKRDVCPENNPGIRLVPQILTNDAEAFAQTAKELWEMGYAEVNLNLGCPSKTVVSKKRGAGFLAEPEKLERFLEGIFERCDGLREESIYGDNFKEFSQRGSLCATLGAREPTGRHDWQLQNHHMRISIKTRLGMTEPEEFEPLLEIFNRYPLAELIVHPRVQADYYKNYPRMELFDYALAHCKCPLVYNGDICSVADYERLMARNVWRAEKRPLSAVMIGRGILANPALFGEIRGEEMLQKERFRAFHDHLLANYQEAMSGEYPVLCKMKELWVYMAPMFTDYEKYAKQIRKAKRICDYRAAVRELFARQELKRSGR